MLPNLPLTPLAAPDAPEPQSAPALGVNGTGLTPPAKTLTPEQVSAWRTRITACLEGTKPAIEQGKINVRRYVGQYLDTTPKVDECLVPTDFYYIEAKKAQLFYRLPDVYVKPAKPGVDDAAVVFQAALNTKMGPQGVNVLPTVQQVIFDVICPTGFGGVAIGYQTVLGDPMPGPPDPITQMPMGTVPNIVADWYFIEHIQPGDLIIPAEFVGTDFDKAPYIGQRFKEDVPEDGAGGSDAAADERRLTPLSSAGQSAQRKQRTGYELWYRAYLFDPDVKHPDKIRCFKIYDDEKDRALPVTVRDHPHQRYSPTGKLVKGMKGYPISPVTLRYVSDTWMAPSDATMARNTADELSKGRTQMLRSRDRNMPQWGFDATRVDKDVQAKIERNEMQGGIGFNGPGTDATWPIQKGTPPRETYQFNDVAQSDLQRIWRMGSNQLGVSDDKVRSASEQQITANAAQEAHEADRTVILNWFVDKVVTKFAALMQLYATEQEFVELVGSDAERLKTIPPDVQKQAQQSGQDARVLVPWNKDTIDGLFTFSAKPNSQLFVDAAQEKKSLMDLFSFFANEPSVNRGELTRAIISRYGFDPSKLMQQVPPKSPPPPTISMNVKGDDFNPLMGQAPIILDTLSKLGVPIDMAAVQAAIAQVQQNPAQAVGGSQPLPNGANPAEHGGAAAQAEPLLKHPAEQSGHLQNTGMHAPMGVQ